MVVAMLVSGQELGYLVVMLGYGGCWIGMVEMRVVMCSGGGMRELIVLVTNPHHYYYYYDYSPSLSQWMTMSMVDVRRDGVGLMRRIDTRLLVHGHDNVVVSSIF